jgi:hypothetical protein
VPICLDSSIDAAMFTAHLPRAISPPIPSTVVVLLNKHTYYNVLLVSAFTASG